MQLSANFILNIVFCQLYWTDKNKEKEAGNGPFFRRRESWKVSFLGVRDWEEGRLSAFQAWWDAFHIHRRMPPMAGRAKFTYFSINELTSYIAAQPVWPDWSIYDRFGYKHFLTKVGQIFWCLLGPFWKMALLNLKIAAPIFWATVGKIWLLFIPTSGHTVCSTGANTTQIRFSLKNVINVIVKSLFCQFKSVPSLYLSIALWHRN